MTNLVISSGASLKKCIQADEAWSFRTATITMTTATTTTTTTITPATRTTITTAT